MGGREFSKDGRGHAELVAARCRCAIDTRRSEITPRVVRTVSVRPRTGSSEQLDEPRIAPLILHPHRRRNPAVYGGVEEIEDLRR
jgi:hypothetical protein